MEITEILTILKDSQSVYMIISALAIYFVIQYFKSLIENQKTENENKNKLYSDMLKSKDQEIKELTTLTVGYENLLKVNNDLIGKNNELFDKVSCIMEKFINTNDLFVKQTQLFQQTLENLSEQHETIVEELENIYDNLRR